MVASPLVLVNSQSQLPNGVDVPGGSTVTISLASTDGVYNWDIQCIGTDDLHAAAVINSSLVVNQATFTATFTAPPNPDGYGSALIFKSTVNDGMDINGLAQAYLTTTLGIFVESFIPGIRLGAQNETTEGNAEYGWLSKFNNAIRNGLFTGGTLAGDVDGVSLANVLNSIQGVPVVAGSPALNNVLTFNGTEWVPAAAQGGILSGDTTGPASSNTVTAIRGNTVSAVAPTARQFLVENNAANGSAWTTITGDVTSPTTPGALVVGKIQTRTVSATAPLDGYVLAWNNGLSQWEPQPITSGSVTLLGDVTGPVSSNTVTKLQNRAVSSAAPNDGYALIWDTGTNQWRPEQIFLDIDGDVVGPLSGATVVKIQNIDVESGVPDDGYVLTYDTGNSQWQAERPLVYYVGPDNTVLGTLDGVTISYFQITNDQIAADADIEVSKLLPGADGQVLISNDQGHPLNTEWYTLNRDVVLRTASGAHVINISGDPDGVVDDVMFGSVAKHLVWHRATTTPRISQEAKDTAGSPATFTVQAQHNIFGGGAGGSLALTSGQGSGAADGSTLLQTGGTTRVTVNPTGVVRVHNLGLGVVQSDSSGNLTSGTLAPASITPGTAGQILVNNSTPVPAWVSMTGDIGINSFGVTSIGTGVIVDADVSASAAIALSKLANASNRSVVGKSTVGAGAHTDITGTTNQVLRIGADNILAFGAVDLSTMVTGALPNANQAPQTLTGDVTGTTSSNAVTGLNFGIIDYIGTLPNTVQANMAGDVTGNPGTNVVSRVTGSGGIVPITASIRGDVGIPLKYSPVSVAMPFNSDYTLTESNKQYPTLIFTGGATLTADRNIILSSEAGATYTVFNFNTPGFNLTFKGVSGVGVTVPYGGRATIACDGTNWYPESVVFGNASASITSDLSGTNQSQSVIKISGASGVVNIPAIIKGDTSQALKLAYLTKSYPSDADYTLSSSEMANYYLDFQPGATLTADRNVILPLQVGATYSVFNFVTSGINLIFKGATGTGVTVPYGTRTIVYCDGGSNYVSVVPADTIGGDLVGPLDAATVVGIQTIPVSIPSHTASEDGYVLTYVHGSTDLELKPITTTFDPTMGGDVSGLASAAVVEKVHGVTYPIGGSLTTGTIPRVTGASTVAYGALDLANANAVTGTLPTSNQASQTMTGDVTGTTASNVVATITGSGGHVDFNCAISGSSGAPYKLRVGTATMANSNYTLTATDLQYPFLYIQSSPTLSAPRDIICPGTAGVQLEVYNGTAQNLTFKPSGGTGPTVAPNAYAIIHCLNSGAYIAFTFTAGGDLTGSATSQTVATIGNATVASSTSKPAGNVLKLSGANTLTYDAVNLAGGSNHVTGTLPTANQASQTMAGDVTGTTAAATVVKLQGNDVLSQSLGSGQDQYVLTWDNATTKWKALPAGAGSPADLTNYGTIKLAGDFTSASPAGTAAAPQINKLTGGVGGRISVDGQLMGHDSNTLSMRFGTTLVSFSTDADFTAPGSTCIYPILIFTASGGATLTATRTVTISAAQTTFYQSIHWIYNSTGGGQSIIVKGTTGTGVTIPNGHYAMVTSDLTNLIRVSSTNLASASEVFGVLPAANQASQSLGGDLSGTTASGTVAKINGASVTTIGSSNTVLGTTNGTSISYFQVANAQVASGAAIAYSKLNLATSILNSDINASAAIAYSKLNLTGGIVNADVNASAAIAYSKLNLGLSIVNGDIATAAAIGVSKLAAGTAGQFLLNNSTPTPTWTSASGDATISSAGLFTNIGIRTKTLDSALSSVGAFQDGYQLTWVNANNQWEAKPPPGGGLTVGPVDTQTKSANGVVIAGPSIFMQTADATNIGLVSTGTQTMAGAKTFSGAGQFSSTLGVTGAATLSSTLNVTGATTLSSTLDVTGRLTINSGVNVEVTSLKTSNYTVTTADNIIGIGTLAAGITVTMPSSPSTGDKYVIKDVNGSCSTFRVKVDGNGKNIDGVATLYMGVNYQSLTLVYTSAQWSII